MIQNTFLKTILSDMNEPAYRVRFFLSIVLAWIIALILYTFQVKFILPNNFHMLTYLIPGIIGISLGVLFGLAQMYFQKSQENQSKNNEVYERYNILYHNSKECIFYHNLEGKIIDANKKTLQTLQYEKADLDKITLSTFHNSQYSLDQLKNAYNIILEQGTVQFKSEISRKDGKILPVEISSSLFQTDGGIIIQGIFRELDEQVPNDLENQVLFLKNSLQEQSKLATLGEISTGIAHEINQPITFVSGLLQTLDYDLGKGAISDTKHRENIKVALHQIERVTEIVNHLRVFGRKDDAKNEYFQIDQVIENSKMLLAEKLRKNNIHLDVSYEDGLPLMKGSAIQIEQIFINLMQNAIDALMEAGTENAAIIIALRPVNNMVEIQFTDNGPGMSQDILEKIFESFFTTKEAGKGTGLGLSIIKTIIEEHQGNITCTSTIGEGTTFTILLPGI